AMQLQIHMRSFSWLAEIWDSRAPYSPNLGVIVQGRRGTPGEAAAKSLVNGLNAVGIFSVLTPAPFDGPPSPPYLAERPAAILDPINVDTINMEITIGAKPPQ